MKNIKNLTLIEQSYYYANQYYTQFKHLLEFDELVNEIYIILASYIKQNNKLPTHISPYVNRKLKYYLVENNVTPDYSITSIDILVDDICEKHCLYKDLAERIEECLDNRITPRECFVVKCRYGFENIEPQLYKEIGKLLNLSVERIRCINHTAIRKLRNYPKTKYLIDYY